MKEKISKILVIVLILLIIYKIIEISAAYKTAVQSNIGAYIEPWKILINKTNITAIETKTFDLESFINESSNVAQGKIAPGSTFTLPIEIDATETKNLDIRYDITIELDEEVYPNIQVQNILEQNSQIIRTGENTYTGIILKENTKVHNLSVNLIWEDVEENNEKDTYIGTLEERQKVSVPITIYVSQYGNEPIEEYIEGN